jgi:hypothetical protein
MKKAIVYVVGIAFLLSALAFAADKPASDAAKVEPVKAGPAKVARMNATGKVIEITDKSIKIERTVKDKVETMLFALDKPSANIAVNDLVKIAYIEKDGQLTAARVAKVIPKKKEIKIDGK